MKRSMMFVPCALLVLMSCSNPTIDDEEIAPPNGPSGVTYIINKDGLLVEIPFTDEEGRAIAWGDIDFGPTEYVSRSSVRTQGNNGSNIRIQSHISVDSQLKWRDDGTYIYIPNILSGFAGTALNNVKTAMAKIEEQTRVRFIKPTQDELDRNDYVKIFPGIDRCQVGRQWTGIRQETPQYCRPSGNYWQVSMHELGHAIGLEHEHQRSDRDQYIQVYLDRTTSRPNYILNDSANSSPNGAYDFGSLMHYGPYQFLKDDRPVMVPNPAKYPNAPVFPKPGALITPLTTRTGFSRGDLAGIEAMYPTVATRPCIPQYGYTKTCSSVSPDPFAPNQYVCNGEKSDFIVGEAVTLLAKATKVCSNHRFKAQFFLDGVYQREDNTATKIVSSGDSETAYYLPSAGNPSAGNWLVKFFTDVGDGKGFFYLDMQAFTVRSSAPTAPYSYSWTEFCAGVTGPDGAGDYLCNLPKRTFRSAENFYLLTKLTNLQADYRFKYDVYFNGTYQYQNASSWYPVGGSLSKAYFQMSGGSLAPGTWTFEINVEANDGKGFRRVDSQAFSVVP